MWGLKRETMWYLGETELQPHSITTNITTVLRDQCYGESVISDIFAFKNFFISMG